MTLPRPREFRSAFRRYRNLGQIGQGGSGHVVRVQADGTELFAIKYLAPEQVASEKRRRFKNELAFCSKTDHPNVIKVLDWGLVEIRDVECLFYVMPLFSSNLRVLMKERIPHSQVMDLFGRILDGVEAAHLLGVCHRDLKPENILCSDSPKALVVADFGIARFTEPLMQTYVETKASSRLANFRYAAPEQIERGRVVDHRADVYALGLMLNEMFTGRVPHGQGYAQIASASAENGYLDDLVRSMLMQNPEDRPSSIAEIKRELIAHGEAAAREQKLSELKSKVILKAEVDDPLVSEPPVIVDSKWDGSSLVLRLSRAVNSVWADCFHDPGDHTFIMGYGPEKFRIAGDSISVQCDSHLAQQLKGHAQEYAVKANAKYGWTVEQAARQRQAREEEALKQRIKKEEEIRAVNEALRQ